MAAVPTAPMLLALNSRIIGRGGFGPRACAVQQGPKPSAQRGHPPGRCSASATALPSSIVVKASRVVQSACVARAGQGSVVTALKGGCARGWRLHRQEELLGTGAQIFNKARARSDRSDRRHEQQRAAQRSASHRCRGSARQGPCAPIKVKDVAKHHTTHKFATLLYSAEVKTPIRQSTTVSQYKVEAKRVVFYFKKMLERKGCGE
eukprot:scaffold8005_cov118-Isochrysis_galbana.AAC.19